jgi:hypothetical protein
MQTDDCSMGPISRPPRSPGQTPLEYFRAAVLRNKFYATEVHNREEVCRILQEADDIRHQPRPMSNVTN